MSPRLEPLTDTAALVATRRAWHAVAEHVLAAARYATDGHIGLVVVTGGFGAPVVPGGGQARVDRATLRYEVGGAEHTVPLSTVAAAAAALGIEPGNPPVFAPSQPLAPDAPLQIDLQAAAILATWFDLSWSVLAELGETPTLWPEHFDAAIELGDEAAGTRGTFGASPGDADHDEPYLYVTHWAEVPDAPFWNDSAFAGASLGYSEIAAAPDPGAAVAAFFEEGRAILGADR
jgi:hypothetical protein